MDHHVNRDARLAKCVLISGKWYETLFVAAFEALDKLPDEVCRKVARRVHEGSYGRMTGGPGNDSGASKTDALGSVPAPSNTAVFKSTAPRPPKFGH